MIRNNISHPKPIYFRLRFVDVLLICRGIGSYIHYYFKLRFKIKSNKNNYIWYEFHWHTVNSSFLNIYWHWCKFTIFIFFFYLIKSYIIAQIQKCIPGVRPKQLSQRKLNYFWKEKRNLNIKKSLFQQQKLYFWIEECKWNPDYSQIYW